MIYYEVETVHTYRPAGRGRSWTRNPSYFTPFPTEQKAREFVRSLGKKRVPSYIDGKNGEAIRTGWVVSRKERENGRIYYVQDWVSIYKVEKERVKP
jgi:hypothetical protein